MNVLFINTNTDALDKDILVLNVDRVETLIEKTEYDYHYYLKIKVYKGNSIFQSVTKYETINDCKEVKDSIVSTSNEYKKYCNGDIYPQKMVELIYDDLTIL